MFPATFKYKVIHLENLETNNESIQKHFDPVVNYLNQAILMGEKCLIYG
jgi:hypothetical protein